MQNAEGSGATERVGLQPGRARVGSLRVPSSKSLAARHLMCAALAQGGTHLQRLPQSRDVLDLVAALETAGIECRRLGPQQLELLGSPPGPSGGFSPAAELQVGESGTAARLLTAAVAFCGRAGEPSAIYPSGTLARRASAPLFRALAAAGVTVEPLGERGAWPVRLTSLGPPSDVLLTNPLSSQEVSGLAIALAARPDENRLRVLGDIPSRPYLDMSLAVLRQYGARIREERTGDGWVLHLRGPLRAPTHPVRIEADASAAAVALAAGCLSDGDVYVAGFEAHSLQGDVRIVRHLEAFGCRAGFEGGVLRAAGYPTRGASLDLSATPDLAPPLAAVAAGAAARGGESELHGLQTLPGKESSRIAVLATGLRRCGFAAHAEPDRLTIGPGSAGLDFEQPARVELESHGDHRMAFAFALLGLIRPGVFVTDPGCVAKSWPDFWRDIEG